MLKPSSIEEEFCELHDRNSASSFAVHHGPQCPYSGSAADVVLAHMLSLYRENYKSEREMNIYCLAGS